MWGLCLVRGPVLPGMLLSGRMISIGKALAALYGRGTGPPACRRLSLAPLAAASPSGLLWGAAARRWPRSPLETPIPGLNVSITYVHRD